ncbi:hypothetical protein [Corynebacterium sp. HMSC036D02]|uniref:hypothetical protein n=1 Tax=Corynebacterium sp. HMSC036D02 TaxID=1715013 RepID=UPI0008A9E7EB|nr:hypothetical protein [Corynebacterium sp. HMSC036D02]OHO64843.1 hypothetical protein HMPREF2743_07905 [Corynebacterium sp. HMSC036D02]
MTVTNYVVPHSGFGEPRRLTVDAVTPEMFLQLLSLAEANHLPVTLCGHSRSGFRVRHNEDIVGVIPASQSTDYAELDSIIGAGLTPQATAEIVLREDAAEETIPAFEVLLPEPGLCVPHNIPPAGRWGMLNGDRALRITDFSATPRSLPKHPSQLLVRLSNTRHFFRRTIEIHLDDELVATIPRDQASQLSDTITGFKHEGLIAIARAYFTPDTEVPTLTVYTEDGTPDTNFAMRTAGVIAAAAGAAAATAASTDRAHAAIAPFGSSQTAGAAQTAGSTAAKGAQALSLNSVGAAATAGTQVAVASTGLKLAGAAGIAVLIGGTANFVSSVHALHPDHDHITDSVLEGYTTSLLAPSPANDEEIDSEPSAWADEQTEGTVADTHHPQDQNVAAEPTELSEPIEPVEPTALAEPSELTEQPAPTELAEPTQHAELAAPAEVAPSARNRHEVLATPEAEKEPEEPGEITPSTHTSEPSSTPTQKATPTSAAPDTTPTTTPRTSEPAPSTTAAPVTSEPSDSLTSEPTTESSETPTSEPTTEPTPEPSETPTPEPERTPEPSRTPDPTPEPKPEPTPDRDGWVIIIEFG